MQSPSSLSTYYATTKISTVSTLAPMTPPHNNCQQLQIFLQKLWFWKGQGMVTESTLSGIFRETPMAMNLVGLRLMLISSAKVANDIMIMVMLLMLMLMRISSTKIARPNAYRIVATNAVTATKSTDRLEIFRLLQLWWEWSLWNIMWRYQSDAILLRNEM